MAKRKEISKKTRFEVFKRDSFKCQYCGCDAPNVILECDHIIPVAEGGENDLLNLVTSCRDCNRGKGKTRLTDKSEMVKQKARLNVLNEQREQLEMMTEWRMELMKLQDAQVAAIDQYISTYTDWCLSDSGKRDIKMLIKRFGFDAVHPATQTSFERYYTGAERTWHEAFGKIGGICFNRRKKTQEGGEASAEQDI